MRIAVVVKGYPRLSETFIAQEILGLERRGLELLIVSLRQPTDGAIHDVHREIRSPVLYLPEYLKDDPARVASGRARAATLPGFARAEAAFARDLARDRSASRYRRFGQACVLASELPDDVGLIYVHFLHTPASVARYAATMRAVPWSFSAHAKDIWTSPDWEVSEKIADAAWGVTCTAANVARLGAVSGRPEKVHLVYHGLDFGRFPPPAPRPADRDGVRAPVTILSVCRAVEKKGLDDVVRALARLPGDLDWRFVHIGGGGLVERLKALAARLGIADRITWRGAQPRSAVIAACGEADLFVLASRIARNGDRDGLPNVLMEAQALGLAVVSTRVSAIPEVVDDGETGVLVEPKDPAALAIALEALIRDPARRSALARKAAATVRRRFSSDPGIDEIAGRLRQTAAVAV
jgi:glycosyltransferase involved in cell wall biosynthesis